MSHPGMPSEVLVLFWCFRENPLEGEKLEGVPCLLLSGRVSRVPTLGHRLLCAERDELHR